MSTVTIRLRQLRKAKGWRQIDLGARFFKPVDPARISRWESGQEKPRSQTLVELAQILGCSIDCLLGLTPFEEDETRGSSTDARKPSAAARTKHGRSTAAGALSARARIALFRADIRTSEQVLALGDRLIYVRGIWRRLASEITTYAKAHPGEEFPTH